jgi:hypothetical protein
MGAECGCRRSNKSPQGRHRAVARAGVVRGAFRWSARLRSAVRSSPHHFACRRRFTSPCQSRPSAAPAAAGASDAAADPSTSFRFAPFRSRAGSLRCGVGGRAAPLQRLRRLVLECPPTPPLPRFFGWLSKVRKLQPESTRHQKHLLPVGQVILSPASGLASACGCSFVAVCLPRLSLRSPLQLMPALRPPQAATGLQGMRFGRVVGKIKPCWLAQAPRPASVIAFMLHAMTPAPRAATRRRATTGTI